MGDLRDGNGTPESPTRTERIHEGEPLPVGDGAAARLAVVESERYRREGEVGQGGIGTVVRAVDTRLERVVAIKELNAPGQEERFVREALITARLEHPGIVPVHEVGRWPDGAPFYAMKLVSGRTLKEVAREATTLAQRLALVPKILAVAEALAYAHAKGVIHRDVKPANIIIGDYGETVLIDWGLAKRLGQNGPEAPSPPVAPGEADVTRAGDVLGTPAYMAPEQARGEPVDARADVWAVGVILYQVLAGQTPYVDTGGGVTSLMASIAMGKARPLESLVHDPPEDLLTIIRKAMSYDPAGRYPTAAELAEDLRRFSTGQLVSARRYRTWDLVARWLRRRLAIVAVAAAALLVTAVLGVISVTRIVQARRVAEARRVDAERQRNDAVAARADVEKRNRELILLEARRSLADDPTASIGWLKTYPADADGWDEVIRIADDARSRGVAQRVYQQHMFGVTLSRDGAWIAYVNPHEEFRLDNLMDGRSVLMPQKDLKMVSNAFSPDGKKLVSMAGDGTMLLWDLSKIDQGTVTNQPLGKPSGPTRRLLFTPDGQTLGVLTLDGSLELWTLATRTSRRLATGLRNEYPFAFTPDGKGALLETAENELVLADLASGAQRPVRKLKAALAFDLSPDGDTIAVAGDTVTLYSMKGGEAAAPRTLPGTESSLSLVAFSPDGQWLVTGGSDGPIHIWRTSGGPATLYHGHRAQLVNHAIGTNGLIVTTNSDGSTRVWPLPQGGRIEHLVPGGAQEAVLSADGRLLAAGGKGGEIYVWDRAAGGERLLQGHTGRVGSLAFSPDGARLASLSLDGTARLWTLASGESRVMSQVAPHTNLSVRWTRDGKHVVYGGMGEHTIRVYDAGAARIRCEIPSLETLVIAPAADGTVVYGDVRAVKQLDPAACESRALYEHNLSVTGVAASPDGRYIVSGGFDYRVLVWDARTRTATPMGAHGAEVVFVAVSPDSKLAATTSFDRSVGVWDLDIRKARAELTGHESFSWYPVFTPDSRYVVASGEDNTVRLWEIASGRGRVLRGHEIRPNRVEVTPDGKQVITGSSDGTVRVWQADLGDLPEGAAATRAWLDTLTSVELDAKHQPATRAR